VIEQMVGGPDLIRIKAAPHAARQAVVTGAARETVMDLAKTRCGGGLPVRRLMDRLGIDPSGSVHPRTGLAFAIARRICRTCQAGEECRRMLRAAGPPLRRCAGFCPNAALLHELLSQQPWVRRPESRRAVERAKAKWGTADLANGGDLTPHPK
jgi:hypothetical protein